MSDIIQLLPDSVANQIAAGEVIQRPASVIKELVENSVDAGATRINIVVVDAGRTLIQVIDDGKGMSDTDARLAFERHATSKIRQADDLFTLQTMGFRGEALPSIVAVAQVELRTRQAGDDLGTCLNIAGSKVIDQKPCSCPVGSNFRVENLFYNIPARRKFLKSNTTELNQIITAFERIALVYPDIAFTFHSNGSEVYNLRRATLRQRIADVFGNKLNQSLLPVETDTSFCKVSGFVGKPESAKKKCPHQYFFVNGRYMKHPYFAKAVQTAFDRMIPATDQVPFFLYFDVPPADIDVNIHPTKTEIKFENEQAIWQILLATVREAVGLFSEVPSIDFDTEGKPDIPVFGESDVLTMPKPTMNPKYNPFKTSGHTKPSVPEDWTKLFPQTKPQQEESELFSFDPEDPVESPLADKSTEHYQFKGQYIVTSVKSGLMIINQHRAHIRVLYEQYLKQIEENKSVSQRMLFPEAVQFDVRDTTMLDIITNEMTGMGFELTPLGAGNYAINAVPAGCEGINASVLVEEMINSALSGGSKVKDEINRALALSLARQAAIPKGQVLSNEEMEDLVSRLLTCSNINYTPDGKKIYTIYSQNQLEQLIG